MLSWTTFSVGQDRSRVSVFVTIPELESQRLRGLLGQANFELQGVVPIASALSFPTAIVCGPGNVLYVAEFALYSGGAGAVLNDIPEARIVEYSTDGKRGPIKVRIPETYVISMALGESGELFFGTGVWPDATEFAGVWKANPNGASAEATQVIAPSDLQELLDFQGTLSNPRPLEIRQLALIPQVPADRPFAGDLLFTAGGGTLGNWFLYRSPLSGAKVGKPEKVNIGKPWHSVASGSQGDIFIADFVNGFIARLNQDLDSTELFAELIEPFQLAVDAEATVYVTTKEFEFDNLLNGKNAPPCGESILLAAFLLVQQGLGVSPCAENRYMGIALGLLMPWPVLRDISWDRLPHPQAQRQQRLQAKPGKALPSPHGL
jgi:hypothetical protein